MNDKFYKEQLEDLIEINKQNHQFEDEEIDFIERLAEYDDEIIDEVLFQDENEVIYEIADSMVDIYYNDQLKWISKDNNHYYIEEYFKEFGQPERFDFFKVITQAQWYKYQNLGHEVVAQLKDIIQEKIDNEENEEETKVLTERN